MTAEEIQGAVKRISGFDVTVTAIHAASRFSDTTRQAATPGTMYVLKKISGVANRIDLPGDDPMVRPDGHVALASEDGLTEAQVRAQLG